MSYTRQITSALFLFFILVGLASSPVMVGCDTTVNEADTSGTTINNPSPGSFSAIGTVTGRVLDRVSSEPIQGATVSLAAAGDSLTATTDASGKFSLSEVPVNTSTAGGSGLSTTYSVHITTPDGSRYRDFYRTEVELQYGDTNNGGGSANNLAASATFPLSKLAATVTGRAFVEVTNADGNVVERPLNEAPIAFVQSLPTSFDAEGNPQEFVQVQTETDTTESDGTFTFENVEEGTDYTAVLKVGNDDTELFSGSTPTSQSGNSERAVGAVNVTNQVPPLKIVDVTPNAGADVPTAEPTITFQFNRPLADNAFIQSGPNDTGTDQNNDGPTIADELGLFVATAKASNPDNCLPIEVSINSDRTELSVSPREPLTDGYIFEHNGSYSSGNGGGFLDPRFTGSYGIPVQNSDRANFTFSVGVNNNAPAAPSVLFQDGGPPTIDYTSASVTADLQVPVGDVDSIKGYEVYYRSQDIRADRTAANGQFVKAEVSPEASAGEFDQNDRIVPVSAAEFGTLSFSATADLTPVAADDGSYGPIEWKVRAVNVNNVRGDFSSVIETGDNVQPRVIGASATDEDGDGDDDIVTVEFTEALDTNTALTVGNYTLTDGAGTTRDILNSVREVNNVTADDQSPSNPTEVVITLDDGNSINAGDEIQVDNAVLDLSTNNGVSQDGNDNSATF